MVDIAGLLTLQIKAVCPIDGVCLGVLADKTTWTIQFQSIATADQQAAAQNILTNFDINMPANINAAFAMLDKIDTTYAITVDNGVVWPSEWQQYRKNVRACTKSGALLPAMPSTYPDGTPTS